MDSMDGPVWYELDRDFEGFTPYVRQDLVDELVAAIKELLPPATK